ncbi:M13 family peptidase [Adhaeribacter arboris]|uniref:M13 family peptidase n=1 Tax=Adhaeribacter arboris TaxID=2072846 RepID=A0A2T2YNZ9_9BACT|nr:M13 family metallopeptidase [Adhaeribacter arboris]PSR57243.1 M13 family peptidase [Adhaeribacter arboris]
MKNLNNLCYLFILAGLLVSACQRKDKEKAQTPDLISSYRDTTVAPGNDFFQYANGAWLKKHPIPASESNWSIGKEVQNEIYARLRKISETASFTEGNAGSNEQKIGDFYHTGMDTVSIEKQGIEPLKPELNRITAIKSNAEIPTVVARLQILGVNALIGPNVEQDAKNSEQMALYLWQSGLGLPNRDYYFNNDSRTQNIRKEYGKHLAKMFTLLGQDVATAKQNSERVMRLETSLAKASRKLEDLRDPYANYHKMAISEVNKLTLGIDWQKWLGQMQAQNLDSVIVGQPEFYRTVGQLLKTTPLPDWQAYLQWHLVHAFAEQLPKAFDNENFRFYGTVMQGRTQQRARWKRVLDEEESAMGEVLGKLFVADYFSPATKKRYETMVDNVVAAFRDHIQQLDWMTPPTKEKALTKLNKIKKKVGYPDKWKDFSALKIDRSAYVQNVMRANEWWYRYHLNKLGKPVNRDEWSMTPQTYNAYYNPSNNEIVLPAAIFAIPGLRDEDADDAIIYGYAGASTIGHELTHGFDDQGSQFDAQGNLKNWWAPQDQTLFKKKVNEIVKQFNGYVVLDSLRVNGKATAGENIADLGGIVIALDAFKKTEQYQKGEKMGGLTPTQRYFLGYALGWQGHQRAERLAQQILTDVHSPANLRVNGPLADVPEFYQAFNVQPNQQLYRPDSLRVKIW